jgi:hypothetical protein
MQFGLVEALFVTNLWLVSSLAHFFTQRWRQCSPQKHSWTSLRCLASQKIILFIVTAVRNSNPTA